MFNHSNTEHTFTDDDIKLMNAALNIRLSGYQGLTDEELEQLEKHHSDAINDRFHEGCTLDELVDDGRVYAENRSEQVVVYRIPGHRHGDGQVDSEDNPVWLTSDIDWEAIPDGILPSI